MEGLRSFLLVCGSVLSIIVLPAQKAQGAEFRQPYGFYVMQAVHNQNVNDATLASPALRGIHIRDEWGLTEPTQGVDSFTWLDSQASRAQALNKEMTLGIYAGNNSPSWLGAPLVGGAPLPWDSRVISAYNSMVARLGQHFASNTSIKAVHMSSPATSDSMEMFLATGVTSRSDYSDQKIIDVWEGAINAYAQAFPSVALVLDVAMVPNTAGAVTDAVTSYAQGLLGDRFTAIHCSLKASTNPDAAHHQKLIELHNSGVRIGFEMVGPSSDTTRFGGTFSSAIALGDAAGAEWYQIYQGDISKIPAGRFTIPGDNNLDGRVDALDYITYRNYIGKPYVHADYSLWRSQFGVGTVGAAAVPEPALSDTLIWVLGLLILRRGARYAT